MGCCEAGLAAIAGGAGAAEDAVGGAVGVGAALGGLGGAAAAGECAGGVTTTAGGGAGFSAAGGTGVAGAAAMGGTAGLTGGGVTTTIFSGAAGLAGGFSAAGAGTAGLAVAGVTAAGRVGGAAGRVGADGCCCCSRSFSSFSTSPGLEILERSSFGLISPWPAFSFDEGADFAEKCLRIFSASSSSTELEWVFFSVMPMLSNTSRIALLFTSSSLAKSLIRIFIRSLVSSPSLWLRDHIDLTA